ncbi:HSP20 family protein [Amycolatopsis bartoniae]|uniref:Heat-shock protein Hsp20 n=1 Tax=Amycolatopsis bartoniae TaxID=941986 RepID=A0A8H9IX94_9PSEU|nr:Hsp20/alpha crystallin family protein [Amycolatopsis bartoniae]MBB2937062.1 HSP20 family protein [Amycolatopsis bartoniae]TVT04723.1 Hsp20/alpha crystallin family protein [Amycolatopsis bartoniae]GHF52172.1 heat-shock protein Hsp20 [Amycolatopsis bartoniae]
MALPAMRSGATLSRWDPFRELGDLARWFDGTAATAQPWAPSADVTETDGEYVFEVEVPGVRREDITVDLTGNRLAITGELKERERDGVFRRRTRRTGKFSYRVLLPRGVDGEHVAATLEDGVLTVRVPKSEPAQPRRIEISGK